MSRNFDDWLAAYCQYASFSEAPKRMHFFAGVSALAGALQRRVWIEQPHYRWYANHFIVFVAPPGVVSKSTTANIAMNLLKKVPGVHFGPDVVTWQALVTSFAAHSEQFPILQPDGTQDFHAQCALTLSSSELGNLINPQDREMIDLLTNLWDCNQGAFEKHTKGSGKDVIENPWINIIGCTTPAWIAGNFPDYMIGGGWTSRTLFIYAEKKERLVAYPSKFVPPELAEVREALIQDLEHISQSFVGVFKISPEAEEWGEEWYTRHHDPDNPPKLLQDDRFAPYMSRRQAHMHKLAMILSVSSRDDQTIRPQDLATADAMLSSIEEDMPKVFEKMGMSEKGLQANRFVAFIQARGRVPIKEAYRYIHSHFPDQREFKAILQGSIDSGQVIVASTGQHLLSVDYAAKNGLA